MSVNATSLDKQLAELLQVLNSPQLTPAQRSQLEQQAEALRSRGASSAVANFLQFGSTSGQAASGQNQVDATIAQRLSAALNPAGVPAPQPLAYTAGQFDLSGTALSQEWVNDMLRLKVSPEQIQASIDYNRQYTASPQMQQDYAAQRLQQKQTGAANEAELRAIQALGNVPEAAQRLSTVSEQIAGAGRGVTPEQAQENVRAVSLGQDPALQLSTALRDVELGLLKTPPTDWVGQPAQPTAAGTTTGTTGAGGTIGTGGVGATTAGTRVPTAIPQVDLTALREGIKPRTIEDMNLPKYEQQTPAQVSVAPLYQAGPQTPITTPAYTPVDTGQLKQAIAAQGQIQAPGAMESRFGTTEQFGEYVGKVQEMLQPYTESQKQAAQVAYNQAMQKLGDQWAGRGMLASGAAAGQQQQAAMGLTRQMSDIEAQGLANALNTALQTGRMSMDEANTIWNQQMAGAQMAQQGAQFGVGALQNVAGLEAQQGQFGANLGLAVQQAEAQRQQTLADNLARTLGMDISQKQWGQEFDRQQLADIFQRAVTSEQLGFQERQQAQQALLQLTGMDIQQQQWGAEFPIREAGVTGTYQGQPTLQARQLSAALEQQKWDQTMDAWQNELKMDENQFNQWLKTETLKLDQAKAATEANYKAYLKGKGLTEQQGTTATNGYMTQILGLGKAEDAFQYIVQNAGDMIADGADVFKMLQALRNRWPDFYKSDFASMLLGLSSQGNQ